MKLFTKLQNFLLLLKIGIENTCNHFIMRLRATKYFRKLYAAFTKVQPSTHAMSHLNRPLVRKLINRQNRYANLSTNEAQCMGKMIQH